MNLSLSGKTALVCGSTQGIGWAAACELALLGARIILVARDEAKLQVRVKELPEVNGASHTFLSADFANPGMLKSKIDDFARTDVAQVLVNNTGGPPGGGLLEASPEELEATFRQHLICNHLLVQALVPGMRYAGYGRIINVISTSVKQPLPQLGVSNTVRASVANWAKTLANELAADGITVNNVLPGATDTGRLQAIIETRAQKAGVDPEQIRRSMTLEIPARRIGLAEEVGAAIAFLASPAAAYINGINLPVDGGRTACL